VSEYIYNHAFLSCLLDAKGTIRMQKSLSSRFFMGYVKHKCAGDAIW